MERTLVSYMTQTQSLRKYAPESIAILDPLNGDEILTRLPMMNASADISAMVHAIRSLLPTDREIAEYSFEACIAAMRDFGIYLGSIKRHGIEPIPLVPELEPILIELGSRTRMIPRDTVHHYTEWNPRGARQRMYTGEPSEGFLMDGVRLSLSHFDWAIESCKILSRLDLTEPAFVTTLEELAEHVGFFKQAITNVVEKVTPEFFAHVLRPYFEEVTIGGKSYFGPAAAHVPLFLIDLAVWASDHDSPVYHTFMYDSVHYTLPHWRAMLPIWEKRPSLVTQVTRGLEAASPGEVPPILQQATEALYKVLRTLAVFRGKHFGIAKKAYREEMSFYKFGSGGGSIDMLRAILDLTRQNANLVHQVYTLSKESE